MAWKGYKLQEIADKRRQESHSRFAFKCLRAFIKWYIVQCTLRIISYTFPNTLSKLKSWVFIHHLILLVISYIEFCESQEWRQVPNRRDRNVYFSFFVLLAIDTGLVCRVAKIVTGSTTNIGSFLGQIRPNILQCGKKRGILVWCAMGWRGGINGN